MKTLLTAVLAVAAAVALSGYGEYASKAQRPLARVAVADCAAGPDGTQRTRLNCCYSDAVAAALSLGTSGPDMHMACELPAQDTTTLPIHRGNQP